LKGAKLDAKVVIGVKFVDGYGDSRWMTYRQAQIRGYQVRRGEKGTQVQYWRFDEERKIKDSNGRPVIDANGGCTPKPSKIPSGSLS
jgi:antirestriction protein ArdC